MHSHHPTGPPAGVAPPARALTSNLSISSGADHPEKEKHHDMQKIRGEAGRGKIEVVKSEVPAVRRPHPPSPPDVDVSLQESCHYIPMTDVYLSMLALLLGSPFVGRFALGGRMIADEEDIQYYRLRLDSFHKQLLKYLDDFEEIIDKRKKQQVCYGRRAGRSGDCW